LVAFFGINFHTPSCHESQSHGNILLDRVNDLVKSHPTMLPFLITIPHSGESVPPEAAWLKGLPEEILMCDVDRYVDQLYLPIINELKIPHVVTQWHRYLADLNRLPGDVDRDSVEGHANPSGSFRSGLLWVKTTTGVVLMPKPISKDLYQKLVQTYFEPFHRQVRELYQKFHSGGASAIFHLDAHSMPSKGTSAHRDPGETRAEIVVSDCDGKSCSQKFKDLVLQSYEAAGFKTGYNWPYVGGRVTETYGDPKKGHHAIQVELRRDLYMNETTKQLIPEKANPLRARLGQAIGAIRTGIENGVAL
jgi:N-formylglutamate deformylase